MLEKRFWKSINWTVMRKGILTALKDTTCAIFFFILFSALSMLGWVILTVLEIGQP